MSKDNLEQTTPTKSQNKQLKTQEKRERQEVIDAIVGKQLMGTLGQPGNLQSVQVRQLWDNRYRVNVFIGADAASVRVANSYFLVTDNDGNIITSTPKITKQY